MIPPPPLYHGGGMTLRVRLRVKLTVSTRSSKLDSRFSKPLDQSHNAKKRSVTSLYTDVLLLFFSPTPTLLRWRSINPPRFFFYHPRSTDFEEKIEGLWIGGFHVTSSPPYWWTVNKRSLLSSLCLSTSICPFHHCYLCLLRLHEKHL